MSAKTPSLEFVKSQFDKWRASPERSWKVPDYLWDQVMPLLDHYKITKILSTLTLNAGTFKAQHIRYLENKNPKITMNKQDFPATSTFLNIPLPANLSENAASIELTRPDGLTLRFKKIDHSTLSTLLKSFLGDSPCYN